MHPYTETSMKIEIWSDVICPFCGIGQHRLDTALADFAHRENVEVVHRSFQLDPSFPAGTTVSVRDMLRKKYGMTDAQLRGQTERIEAMAAADGLTPYKVGENQAGNTRLAHELLAFAAERGLEAAAWNRLYKAYFGESRSIFDLDALVALGVDIGLDAGEIREALTSGRYTAKVEADGREARELGATGVPFVVIDRRIGIAGAQPLEAFRGALDKAWREHPTPLVMVGGAEACGPEGCEVPESG